MSSIVRRFFWTEDHPLLDTLQTMFDHRAKADAEARKLAESFGAVKAYWQGQKIGGFSFTHPPLLGFKQVATIPEPIYVPLANVGTGKKILQEMEKLSIPDYRDALTKNGLFLANWFHLGNKVEGPEVSFNQQMLRVSRATLSVPFFRVGSVEAMAPNREPSCISDAPVPEGFTEISRDEIISMQLAKETPQ